MSNMMGSFSVFKIFGEDRSILKNKNDKSLTRVTTDPHKVN